MSNASMSRTPIIIAGAVVLVVAVVGLGAWFLFFSEDEPDAVSLDSAIEGVQEDSTGSGSDSGPTPSEVSGTWTVDTSTGDFDFESATGSFAGFRINEELTVGTQTAVGRTGDVNGSITIEETTLSDADFEVDMATITTNESRRDNRVQESLKTTEFPNATFVLTEPLDLGAGADQGEPVSGTAKGDLTIAGVTQSVEIPIEAQLVDNTAVVTGSIDIQLSDYNVDAPTAPVILSVSDTATMEFQLLFTK